MPTDEQRYMEFFAAIGNPHLFLNDYIHASNEEVRGFAIERARERIRSVLGESPGTPAVSVSSPTNSKGQQDGRWELIRDIDKALGESGDPITVDYVPSKSFDPDYAFRGFPRKHGYVSIRVDDRVPLDTLIAELRRAWPKLRRECGLVASRPLGQLKLDLVRFVCLQRPDLTTWEERFDAWNAANPDRVYQDKRALYSDFKRAEKALTHKDGLAWFYDARLRKQWEELVAEDIGQVLRLMADSRTSATIGRPIAQMVIDALEPEGGETNGQTSER